MSSNSNHGSRISNFSPQSIHRMPPVSAAQALEDLNCSPTRCISTGIRTLDAYLQNRVSTDGDLYGGISRGQVTDIYGPPGVGKTAFAMQLAASVLHQGEEVVWSPNADCQTDASQKIPGPRLLQILTSFKPSNTSQTSSQASLQGLLSRFNHFSTPSLAHLIALISYFMTSHPSPNTGLLVIDSLSALTTAAFPRDTDHLPSQSKLSPNAYARKFPTLQCLISNLQKIATTRNIAIFIAQHCVTKVSDEHGAILVPAINTTAWEQGLRCRIALFRDWSSTDELGGLGIDMRIVKVDKAEGTYIPEGSGMLVGFKISESGIAPHNLSSCSCSSGSVSSYSTSITSLSLPHKRKFLSINTQTSDSEEDDENYGWRQEDRQDLPSTPPEMQESNDFSAIKVNDEETNKVVEEFNLGLDSNRQADQREPVFSPKVKPALIENSESDDEFLA